MDLYQLKTFFTLGKIKNFTKAAEALFVTQSAVSHAIKKLENSVDTPLIERKGRHIALTPAGRTLFRSCGKIFNEVEKAGQEIAHYKKKADFSIRIGCTVEFGNTLLINNIKPFLTRHPDIHLDFWFSHSLIDPLLRDDLDLVIDCKSHLFADIERIPLFREQYVVIASPAFIREQQVEGVIDLERVNLLSMDRQLAWWHNFLTAVPQVQSLNLRHVVRINHIRGMINAACAGLGIGFVPRYTVIEELDNRILVDPFPDIQPAADYFSIFIKKEKLIFEKNQRLIEYLKAFKPEAFGSG
jgi:DNA-binding transcriptional LysR family regulator